MARTRVYRYLYSNAISETYMIGGHKHLLLLFWGVFPALWEIDSWPRACRALYTELAWSGSRHITVNEALSGAFQGFEMSPLPHHAQKLLEAVL